MSLQKEKLKKSIDRLEASITLINNNLSKRNSLIEELNEQIKTSKDNLEPLSSREELYDQRDFLRLKVEDLLTRKGTLDVKLSQKKSQLKFLKKGY